MQSRVAADTIIHDLHNSGKKDMHYERDMLIKVWGVWGGGGGGLTDTSARAPAAEGAVYFLHADSPGGHHAAAGASQPGTPTQRGGGFGGGVEGGKVCRCVQERRAAEEMTQQVRTEKDKEMAKLLEVSS